MENQPTELFNCFNCKLNKRLEFIGTVLEMPIEQKQDLRELIKAKQQYRAEIYLKSINTTDTDLLSQYQQQIKALDKENIELVKQLREDTKRICKLCVGQGQQKVVAEKKFICAVCDYEYIGDGFGCHIANYEEEGIKPREWTIVCRYCKDNYVIEDTDIYCPRQLDVVSKSWSRQGGKYGGFAPSDGSDSWDIDRPQYNCDCPVPREKQEQRWDK